MATKTKAPKAPGIISPAELYHLDEAKDRLRWNVTAMRTARRNGLKIRYAGGRGYLLGADILAYIDQHGRSEK